jgi:transposase
MANQIMSMNKIREVLRYELEGKSRRSISKLTGISRNTVDKYIRIFSRQGIGLKELKKLSDNELEAIVVEPVVEKSRWDSLYRLFSGMETELKQVGMTRRILWERYKVDHPSGIQYSQFCTHFNRYLSAHKISYVFEHKAGDKLMVDYAGKKLHLVDSQTGEQIEVEFFVGILASSGYTFGKACMSQQSGDFLGCVADNLSFIGGVPSAIVCDNLKPAVKKASKYDPEINQSMADFGLHYDTAILPTRAYSPKDKALVENAVNILYTRVYAPLHGKVFHTLQALNKAISELVEKHNRSLYQNRDTSRSAQFESIERAALKPLPMQSFELRKYQKARVHPNCHVLLSEDKHYYSVPYQYLSKEIRLAYSKDVVEIYHHYDRIATHSRVISANKYSTTASHLHPKHQYYRNWSKEFFLKEGTRIGAQTELLMSQILTQSKHPEQGFKLCQGVLMLAKKHGNERIEEAAAICLAYDYISYSKLEYVLSIDIASLNQDQDGIQAENVVVTSHENLRGPDYYQ